MKKYSVITYGCQANVADSERIAGMLEALGMVETSLEEADLVLVTTCSVRQASEDKVYGLANKIKQLRAQNKDLGVVLTGCMVGSATGTRARIAFRTLKNKTPWVDFYLNINELNSLPNLLLSRGLIDEWAVKALNPDWRPRLNAQVETAYISVSQGCDNFCTFCVVPYSRGKEVSRKEEEILLEVKQAVARGFRQVLLLGQNVNSWGLTPEKKILSRKHLGDLPFADLLRKVHDIGGLEKIKFITSNPFDFSPDLVATLKLPKIDRYLHLPVQSGDNEILKRMGRRHTREEYFDLVDEIRQGVPEMEIGTDIIVGFPGETEGQFLQTAELLRSVRFSVAYISLYSPRPGTQGSQIYLDDIPLSEKRRRHAYLTQVWLEAKPHSHL